MNSESFNKLRLGVTTGIMGSALMLAGGAVSRVQAAEGSPSRGGLSFVTVTRTGFSWIVSNDTSTNGISGMGLTEASQTASGTTTGGQTEVLLTDAFDGCEVMAVDGISYADPDGTLDLVGDALTGDPDTIAGLEVSREFRWSGPLTNGTAVVRSLNNFTNAGGTPVSVTVSFGCNLGSDSSTFIEDSSEGGGNVMVPDSALWFVSSDEQPYDDPPVTHTRFGAGSSVLPYFSGSLGGGGGVGDGQGGGGSPNPGPGNDDWVDNYDITVPAGQTVHILRFIGLSNGGGVSLADAPIFENISSIDAAGLLVGIPASAQANILNYAAGAPPAPAVAVPTMSNVGISLLAGLMALLAMFGFRRRA